MNAIKHQGNRPGSTTHMGNNPTPAPDSGIIRPYISTVHVLSNTQYRELEKKVLVGHVREDTTPVQVGYLCGIEHVLRVLREGFVSA